MSAYSLAIFDFDGTLADSFPWFVSVLDQTSDKFGLNQVKPEEIGALRDLPSREVLEYLKVPSWKLPSIAIYMRGLFTEGSAAIPLFAGAADMLATLRGAGVKLALVSSNSEANVRQVLGGAAADIDHYACGSTLFGKAQKFKTVLKALGQRAEGTIGIGDEVRDIEAARQSRLAAGSITFGYNSQQALAAAKPDFLFDSYDELVRVVAG